MLNDYIEGFLLHRESEGRSPKTLTGHQLALRLFATWLLEQEDHRINPADWDASLIRRYIIHLKQRPSSRGGTLAAHSVRCYASSVRAFCRWLHEEEITPRNPAERVAEPKTPVLVKEPFSRVEIKRMFAAAKIRRRNGVRDVALLCFMVDTGCRATEVAGLAADHVMWQQRICKVFGKGGKERVVPISAQTARAMQKYHMTKRRAECTAFFQTEEGRPLTTSGLFHICKRIGGQAGVAGVHPHRFRHTFAVSFLRSGGNLFALQRILGHTTLSMTQRYVSLVADDLRDEHQAHSPVDSMLVR